jgi:hypothetical protein
MSHVQVNRSQLARCSVAPLYASVLAFRPMCIMRALKVRLGMAVAAGLLEALALVASFLSIWFLGSPWGVPLAVAFAMSAPVLASLLAGRVFSTLARTIPLLAAAPVWILIAFLSRFFSSLEAFVNMDAIRWDGIVWVAAAAAFGAAIATKPRVRAPTL